MKYFWIGTAILLSTPDVQARDYAYVRVAPTVFERQNACEGGVIDHILKIQKLPNGDVEPYTLKIKPGVYYIHYKVTKFKKAKSGGCTHVTAPPEIALGALKDAKPVGSIQLSLNAGKIYFLDVNKSLEGEVVVFDEYPLNENSFSEFSFTLLMIRGMLLDCQAKYPAMKQKFADAYNNTIVSKWAKEFGFEEMPQSNRKPADAIATLDKADSSDLFSSDRQCSLYFFESINVMQDLYGHREEEIASFLNTLIVKMQREAQNR